MKKLQPHALMFPFPAQGHINPMMQLAKRLMEEGFFITFVNTQYNHARMLRAGLHSANIDKLPNLRFEQLSDGLPDCHERFNARNGLVETVAAFSALSGPLAKLVRCVQRSDASPPLTCIISDSFCSWVQDVADQFRIPRVSLWTTPVHANLAYTFQSTLASKGLIPVTDEGKLQEVVNCREGVEPMKLEDFISFFLVNSTTDFLYQWFLRSSMKRIEEAAWNLGNNIEELETQALNVFKKEVPNFLPIGPLLPMPDVICSGRLTPHYYGASSDISTSLWPEDSTCHDWLSQHEKASVIYMSFGSIASMSEDEVADLIVGLEESGAPFLWAVRPDQGSAALAELRAKLEVEPSRHALVVSWAPQVGVLMHPAVGLFFSHCGWNSVLESIVAGVPIVAKAGDFAEQRMNAHYVEEVWKIGMRVPSPATVSSIKYLVSTLLGGSHSARERLAQVRLSALASLSPSTNFHLFIDDMHNRAQSH